MTLSFSLNIIFVSVQNNQSQSQNQPQVNNFYEISCEISRNLQELWRTYLDTPRIRRILQGIGKWWVSFRTVIHISIHCYFSTSNNHLYVSQITTISLSLANFSLYLDTSLFLCVLQASIHISIPRDFDVSFKFSYISSGPIKTALKWHFLIRGQNKYLAGEPAKQKEKKMIKKYTRTCLKHTCYESNQF